MQNKEIIEAGMTPKKKVLVIEDESSIHRALEYRFKRSGFEVVIAEDGEDGLNKAKQENPDLIILDLMLPKMTGERVCKEIRKDENIAHTPIIMLTAKDTDVDKVIGKVIGANSYMTKPFDLNDLLKEMHKLMDK